MLEEKQKSTPISNLGEFGLISHLTKNIKLVNAETVKGVGDDCAVLDAGDKYKVITTDLLVEGVHFNLMYTPLKHLGYKAVVVNLSDVLAMNATPRQITVSIAISNRFSVEALEELYGGMLLACEKFGVDIIGGDTTSSVTGLVISITAIGEVVKDDIVYRNTAKVNDLICVSGDLGSAYMGLQLLEREKEVFKTNPKSQPDFSGYDYILERQLKPEPRVDIAAKLKEIGIRPTSMIDISDGLSSDLIHICNDSGVGCKIYEEKIPVDVATINLAEEFNIDPSLCALNGGEDYELLFTIPLSEHDKVKSQYSFTVIGSITDKTEGYSLVGRNGTQVPLTAQGWDALLNKESDDTEKQDEV